MSTIQNDPVANTVDSRKQSSSDSNKTSLPKQITPSFGATFEAKLQQEGTDSKNTADIQNTEEKEADHGSSQDPASLSETTSLGVSTVGMHKVVQQSISKNYSNSAKNLNNGRSISDQPQINTDCKGRAGGADASAKGDALKKQTPTGNTEQPSKMVRRARVAHGLVDKKKAINANDNSQRRQIPAENSIQPSKITREEQPGHGLADMKRNVDTKVMGNVRTQQIKESSNTPSMLKKDGSKKNSTIGRPRKPLSATFAQQANSKPITRSDQKGEKTSKNNLAGAFDLISASNQNVSRNHGTPRASVSLDNQVIAKNVETQLDQPNECDIMKISNQTPSNHAAKKTSLSVMQSILEAKNFSSDSTQLKVNHTVNHTLRDTPITLGETSLQANIQPRVEPAAATPYSQSNLQAIQRLQSLIHDHVSILRAGGQQSLQVAIRPESGIAMMLTLQQVENQVLVAAKMDESTANLLKPQWQELQRELESQGIKLNQQEIGDNSHTKNQENHSKKQEPTFNLEGALNDQQTKKVGIDQSSPSPFATNHNEEHEGTLLSYA